MKRVHVSGDGVGRSSVVVSLLGTVALGCLSAGLIACEEEKPKAAAPVVSASVTPAAAAAPKPEKAKEPEKSGRPEKIDTTVTAERKSAIASSYADAKGFLVASELEETMKKNKALKDKGAALKAFDKQAQGKWVLFTGPVVNLTDTGFDLGVTFTPRMENDPMGMSRQFFMVTLTNIDGYSKEDFKTGQVVVALAKYDGAGKASKGYELVAKGNWK
jgi:hypothetical protein